MEFEPRTDNPGKEHDLQRVQPQEAGGITIYEKNIKKTRVITICKWRVTWEKASWYEVIYVMVKAGLYFFFPPDFIISMKKITMKKKSLESFRHEVSFKI